MEWTEVGGEMDACVVLGDRAGEGEVDDEDGADVSLLLLLLRFLLDRPSSSSPLLRFSPSPALSELGGGWD